MGASSANRGAHSFRLEHPTAPMSRWSLYTAISVGPSNRQPQAVRYGHFNFSVLEKLQKEELVHDLPAIKGVNKLCDGCLIGKQRRTPFPSRTSYSANESLELVHGDICGPIKPATPGGKSLFLLLVDDKSRFMWLTLLQAKSEAVKRASGGRM